MKAKTLLLFALLMLFLAACGESSSGTALQNPVFPSLTTRTGWIVDTTGQLSPEIEHQLESIAEEIEALGYQIGVAVFTNCDCDTLMFATDFGNHNGIGFAETDTGIAVVVFTEKGESGQAPAIAVATGEGADILLTAGRVGRILDATYVPQRSAGEWQQGVVDLMAGLRDLISGARSIEDFPEPPVNYAMYIFWGIVIAIAIIIDGFVTRFEITFLVLRVLAASSGSSRSGSGGSFRGSGASR